MKGFTLMEIFLGVIILVVIAVLFFVIWPMVTEGAAQGGSGFFGIFI